MISGMAGSPCSIRRDGSLSGHEGIQRGRPRATGKGLFWPNHPLERTRHTAAAPLSFVRVCRTWHRANGVQVPVPGVSAAAGEEKGQGVTAR
jgi:hypothetical protein